MDVFFIQCDLNPRSLKTMIIAYFVLRWVTVKTLVLGSRILFSHEASEVCLAIRSFYVQDQWNYYILFTKEIKTSIFDFSFFIKGSFIHIIT